MKYLLILTVGVCLICSTVLVAQETPKPGPEHKKLAFWEGSWNFESKNGGSGQANCKWFDGNFFMVCAGPWKRPSGSTLQITMIFGYNQHEKAYTMYRYWSNGSSDFAKGWVRDNTWTWVFEDERVNDKLQRRQLSIDTSPDSQTMKWEHSVEGEPWRVTTEVKGTKVKD